MTDQNWDENVIKNVETVNMEKYSGCKAEMANTTFCVQWSRFLILLSDSLSFSTYFAVFFQKFF